MNNSKSINQRQHAKDRAKQRFGLDLNKKNLKKIVSMIQKGKATFVKKKSNRISLFEVSFMGRNMIAVYDRKRKNIVTFLYRKMVKFKPEKNLNEIRSF